MKLSVKSIQRILDLRKKASSLVLCFGGGNNNIIIKKSIEILGGKIISLKDIKKRKNSNDNYSILIFADGLNDYEVDDLENVLVILGSKARIILDISNLDLSSNRRDLILSFMKRYNIDVIKGTEDKINGFVQRCKIIMDMQSEKCINEQIKDMARKNNSIIIKADKNYVTDGYNEFIVKVLNDEYISNDKFQYINSCILSSDICNCNETGEKLQCIIVIMISFIIKSNLLIDEKNIYDFINEVNEIQADEIESGSNICYQVKM